MATPKQADTLRLQRPVVLFDGSCPLCSREIAHYRRLSGAASLDWVDIAARRADVEAYGIRVEDAMARFHVRDASGRWQTGAWGFALVWDYLPGYRILAQVVRGARLLPLIDRAYTLFARWRLRRRCDSGSCTTPAADRGGNTE